MSTPEREPYLYGACNDEILMGPASEIQRMARLREAIDFAGTWGEFAATIGPVEWGLLQRLLADQEDYLPEADDEYDRDLVAGMSEWPGWIQQKMLSWVPPSVQERFGDRMNSVMDGPFLSLQDADEAGILSIMTSLGYTLARDDDLMAAACGEM